MTPEQAFQQAVGELERGAPGRARPILETLLAQLPAVPQVRLALARCHELQGDAGAAAQLLEDGLAHLPAAPAPGSEATQARLALLVEAARCHGLAGAHRQARDLLRRAVELAPDNPQVLNNLGNALTRTDDIDEGIAALQRLVAITRDNANHHYNLAKALERGGDPAATEAAYRRALDLSPDSPAINWGFALFLWGQGRMAEGWPYHEKRLNGGSTAPPATIAVRPAWTGAPFPGRRLLVHSEQGHGDAIQFARYLAQVKARGGTVVLQCRPDLMRLFGASRLAADEIVSTDSDLPEFDLRASIMSLPAVFATTEAGIPAAVPYLGADVPAADGPAPADDRLNVGLVWSGNPGNPANRLRAMQPEQFRPLLDLPGVRLFNLQAGDEGRRGQEILGERLQQPRQPLNDFFDLAQCQRALDLTLTICTGPAHLAGAMALPAWVLLNQVADFRWPRTGERTPWYPTMRLMRAPALHAWDALVSALGPELEALAQRKRQGRPLVDTGG